MLRSIKSGQRKMRVLVLKISSGLLVDTLDARQVTQASAGSVELKVPMAQVPVAIGATAVDLDTITFATDFTGDILIMGPDTAEKY
jgi:hypothetical protein